MEASGRVLVVYYEDLIRSLPAQVRDLPISPHPPPSTTFADLTRPLRAQVERIATFLDVPLPQAKKSAVVDAAGFGAMKAAGGMANMLLRKGGIGDWRNHMGKAEWASFDEAFDAALDGVRMAEPLRFHQVSEVDGLPKPRHEQTIDDDP